MTDKGTIFVMDCTHWVRCGCNHWIGKLIWCPNCGTQRRVVRTSR